MIAEIIAAGSEMLTPFRQDTNSLYLTGRLNELGISVAFKTIVGDNAEHLTGAARIALDRADIVLFSGGLGPTEDDLTREAAASALGITLHPDPAIIASLYKRFAERRMTMPPNNAKQADVLDGAELLQNPNGSAPGQFLVTTYKDRTRYVILLPGPPRELKPLYDDAVHPRLTRLLPPRFMAKRQLRMALLPESQVDARTAPIYKQFPKVETTILAHSGEIQLHFQTTGDTLATAQARVDEVTGQVEHALGEDVFSAHGESLEEVVLLMLGMRHQTVAVAESCTGGMLSARLTSVPNSSRVFLGAAVAYTPKTKALFCHIDPTLIEREGAVSDAVARALAEGIRTATGASLGISVTGFAGPAGGTGADAGKPVGLVFIGLTDGTDTQVKQIQLTGDRERIRSWASMHALELLRRSLL